MRIDIAYKTLAELKAFTAQDVKLNKKIYLTDAGKQGLFIYDSTDTTTTDNIGTVIVTTTGGYRYKRVLTDYVKPEWFGAIGDNSTYDTTAIQNTLTFANASGYNVKLSKKTYKITTLTAGDNISIIGNGATLNQVRANGTAIPVLTLGNANKVDNLNIICDPVTNVYTDNGAIYIFDKIDVKITNCYVKNHCMYGVMVDRSRNITITNNRFWSNFHMDALDDIDGIWTNQTDIYVYTNGGGYSENILIHGNRCNSPFTCQGIWINGSGYEKDIIVSDNLCVTTNEDGTPWTATNYWIDAGNGMIRRHGMLLSYQSTANSGIFMISGNICRTTLVTGIYVSGGGLGKGVNVVGNICMENGYTTNTDLSLAGGIAITGACGAAQIVGNQVIDFKAASVLTGAINIQRNLDSNVAHDVYIADNTILNSAGVGYRIQTSSDNITINGGLIKNSGLNDIFYNNFESTSDIENWLKIKNLTIIRNNIASRSVYVDAVDDKKIEIEGVSIKGSDNTTNNGQNSAICIINPNQPVIVKDCIFDKVYDALFFPTGGLVGRFKNIVISNNYFLNVSYAIYADADYPNECFIIGIDNRYENLLQGFSRFTNYSCFREGDVFNNDYSIKIPVSTLTINTGSWVRGDNLYIDLPTSESPYFSLCTVSGTFGTLSSVTGSITTGTKALVVNSATNLRVGMFINIAGVTGTKKIVAKSGTNITIDSNANATVSSAAVTYQTPSFITSPNLTTNTFATLTGSESLTNKSVNGVTLVSGGSTSLFLNQSGTYTTPSGGGTPGGSNTQLQYNNAGALAGISGATTNGTVVTLTSPVLITPALGTPASGNFSSGSFTWPTFNQNTTGSAATLTTPRNINGTAFNGSADITITAAAGTLTGTTLAAGVIASSLTSVGTITSGTWNGSLINSTYGGTGVDNGGRTLTLNTNSGTLAFSNASKTLTIANSITIAGTDSTTLTFQGTDTYVGRTTTDTLTNKRITARVQSTSSTSTFTYSWDNNDIGIITAQAAGLTMASPSGTPTQGQPFVMRIKDNGTARSITWNAIFRAIGVTLPTTTVVSKTMYVSGYYNSTDTKVDIVGYTIEA